MVREEKNQATQTRKMTSIVHKLHRGFTGKKIWIYIKNNLLLFVLLFFGWIGEKEICTLGEISFDYTRRFENIRNLQECSYIVRDGDGMVLLQFPIYHAVTIFGFIVLTVFLFQMVGMLVSYGREENKIRKCLSPINEIALKADELSRMAFTEEKYQVIEDAISNIQPEESGMLSFGDKDLQGIEVAMNNLLTRMRDVNRQQARFVNDASHELRTPIAVIEGYVNMLARWGVEDKKVLEESIAALQREAGHMKHLVEQLLFLARGDSGKTQLEIQDMSLKECMQEIYEESLLIDENHI